MALFEGFPKTSVPFLKQLTKNNNREWFNVNKHRYEDRIRTPALAFIEVMGPQINKHLSPHFLALPKKVGGSLMRVYRDTRFAHDKKPYKTNVGIQFRHEIAKDVHAPGFYVHIEPGNCFLGVGVWRPESKILAAIRSFIVDNPNAWKQANTEKGFKKNWALVGDTLVRPPRGFDPEHELIVDLKRKDFIACMNFDDDRITHPKFVNFVIQHYCESALLMSYLCMAVGVDY